MRLSEAASPAKPLDVKFGEGAVLHITYRVPEYTPNQAAKLVDEASKDPRRMADMACRVVESWDLTDDEDQPIELTAEAVADKVTIGVLSTIMKAVNEDQMPGEADATSNDG